jgi:hypothetical protein
MRMPIIEFVAGLALAALTLRDVFGTVIVPGESRGLLRVARRLFLMSLPVIKRFRPSGEGLPLGFAPAALVASFAIWMGLLGLGFGFMSHALGGWFDPPTANLPQAIYVASSALVTIGLSDTAATGPARWLALAAGFCGLGVMTMAVTYLIEVQGGIARRDVGVLKLTTSAGEPPSAIMLLEGMPSSGRSENLSRLLQEGRDWCAVVQQSHLAHPSLIYFRSLQTDTGWPAALGPSLTSR